MNRYRVLQAALAVAGLTISTLAATADSATGMIERGRYVVKIAGCNDCHTADYAMSGGRVPENLWLTGDALGWRGPWGTTYPTNLRLYLSALSEDDWVKRARALTARPPMPWFNVREMSEQDLRALYRFVRALGPVGDPSPAYLPPGREPKGPVVAFPTPPK